MSGEVGENGARKLPGDGLAALLAVRPRWVDVVPASRHVQREGRWLLHAGPPLVDPRSPPAPMASSATLACLSEGWASNPDEACSLIRHGEIEWLPAQDYRCVTPLAALVSPQSSVLVVDDGAGIALPVCAPLGTLGGPDLRFGTRDTAILERLRVREQEIAGVLRSVLTEPIELLPLAREALQQGDDLHNRTTAATRALATRIEERLANGAGSSRQGAGALLQGLAVTPLFFLTFWMAAAKLALAAAEGREPRTLITRMAGNGEVFGLSLAGKPNAWVTTPAAAPRGPLLDAMNADRPASGAVGDSAVIDALGFGGQALHLAPEARAALAGYLPASAGAGVSPNALGEHPELGRADLRVGLDAARVVESGIVPVVTLAMLDAAGEKGLLGRGVYSPPLSLFFEAVRSVTERRAY